MTDARPDPVAELLDRIGRAPARNPYEAQMKAEVAQWAQAIIDDHARLREENEQLKQRQLPDRLPFSFTVPRLPFGRVTYRVNRDGSVEQITV